MVSQLSKIWSGFSIPDPDPRSGSWLFTHPRSWSCIPDPKSRGQKGTGALIPDPDSQPWKFWLCSDCRGYRWLLTFNGRCCLNNSFNGSALRSFYVQKRILRICYFNIISLIFTAFKLWCPAHLFPNTPRRLQNSYSVYITIARLWYNVNSVGGPTLLCSGILYTHCARTISQKCKTSPTL